jgi:hypothetical protein
MCIHDWGTFKFFALEVIPFEWRICQKCQKIEARNMLEFKPSWNTREEEFPPDDAVLKKCSRKRCQECQIRFRCWTGNVEK